METNMPNNPTPSLPVEIPDLNSLAIKKLEDQYKKLVSTYRIIMLLIAIAFCVFLIYGMKFSNQYDEKLAINALLIAQNDTEIKTLQVENSKLENSVEQVNSNFKDIQNNLAKLQTETTTIETKIRDFDSSIAELTSKTVNVQTEVSKLDSTVTKLDTSFSGLENNISKMEKNITNIESDIESVIEIGNDISNGTLKVKSVSFVDSSGISRGFIGINDKGEVEQVFRDSSNKPLYTVRIFQSGIVAQELVSSSGDFRVQTVVNENGANQSLIQNNEIKISNELYSTGEAALLVYDNQGFGRIRLGMKNNLAGLLFSDQNAVNRLALGYSTDPNMSALIMYDKNYVMRYGLIAGGYNSSDDRVGENFFHANGKIFGVRGAINGAVNDGVDKGFFGNLLNILPDIIGIFDSFNKK